MAKRYYSDVHVRDAFLSKMIGKRQIAVATEIGVPAQNISAMLKGAPITGKVLVWLGFRPVRGLYEKV